MPNLILSTTSSVLKLQQPRTSTTKLPFKADAIRLSKIPVQKLELNFIGSGSKDQPTERSVGIIHESKLTPKEAIRKTTMNPIISKSPDAQSQDENSVFLADMKSQTQVKRQTNFESPNTSRVINSPTVENVGNGKKKSPTSERENPESSKAYIGGQRPEL